MKKRMATLVAAGLMAGLFAGMSVQAEDAPLKIGVTIQTLSNQVWAQQMAGIQEDADADGN